MKPVFLFGNSSDDRTKMIVLLSFQLATRLINGTHMKLSLLMNFVTLICLWIMVVPIGIIEISTSSKYCFCLYFSSLHD